MLVEGQPLSMSAAAITPLMRAIVCIDDLS
jgi:hypothetical protein